jgi:DNA-binding transcriptional LysR family regulator
MTISTDMLAAFVAVAERTSVSAAAVALGVGKSVVSKRVAQLEAAVQATLFARSTRRIALTPAGEVYLDFARRALREVAGAEERLRDLRVELTGRVRLTAPVSWGQRVMSKTLPEFLRLHPAIEIELLLGDRVMDVAAEGIDLALRWTTQPAPELVATPLAGVTWVIAAAPAYLASAGSAPQRVADLARHACLSYWRESSDDTWTLLEDGVPCTVRVRGRYHVNNPEAVVEAALAGLGIALLPGYLCEEALAEGRLLRVLPECPPLTKFGDRITAFATPERMRQARIRALLTYLQQAFETSSPVVTSLASAPPPPPPAPA